jgi:hypothetical protein
MTRTPSAANRSAEKFGSSVLMTLLTCAFTDRGSTSGSRPMMPNVPAVRIACARLATAPMARAGTQP